MKKKVFSLMMTLLLAFVGVAKAELVEVGVGGTTTNTYLPCYTFYNNSLSQQLYTAEEIGMAGTINSIAFYNGGTTKTPTLKFYMVNTSKTSFSSTSDWITASASDLVFEGSVTLTANAWTTITLDTPFEYDGVSNLALITDMHITWSSGLACRVFEGTDNCSLYSYDDSVDFDATNPATGNNSGRASVKNQLQLDITPGGGGEGGQAVVVEIGVGTDTHYVTPYNSLWGYSFVEQIYTADEIGTAGTITAISFNLRESDAAQTNAIDVFMKNVTRSAFGGTSGSLTDWETVTASDMVFSGTVTFNPGWTTITLDTPFEYDGTSNLMIGMHEYTQNYSTRYFYYTSATDKVASFHHDSNNPDPYNLGSYSGNKYVSEKRANIKINITTTGGDTPDYQRGLHTFATDGVGEEVVELIDSLYIERPNRAWMEPYHFQLYNDGTEDVDVVLIDFLHNNGYFSMAEGTEYPFTVAHNGLDGAVDLYINTNTEWDDTEEINSLLTVNTDERSTHLYAIVAAPYTPYCPDVVEEAFVLNNGNALTDGFTWRKLMSDIWDGPANEYELHANYDLPDYEDSIPDGYDAVLKFTVSKAMMLNARVKEGYENGKVALYTEDFGGEAGPMADNNYTERPFNGGGITPGGSGELTVHDGDPQTTNSYVPVYGFYADAYLKSEMVYPAVELSDMTGKNINSMKFYATNTTNVSWGSANFQVFMKEVSDATISAFSGAGTVVYEGPLSIVDGEMTVNFTTSYHYNGDNLLVGFYNTVTGSYVSCSWKGQTITGASVQGYNYSSFSSISPTQRNFLPKTTFAYGNGRSNRDVILAEGFENGLNGWTMNHCDYNTGVNNGYTAHSGDYVFRFYYTSDYPQYLISPMLTGTENGVDVSFYYARYSSSYEETFQVGYSTTTNATSAFTWEPEVTVTNLYNVEWLEYTTTCPAGTKYVAVKCTSDDQFYLFVDDFTFTTSGAPAPVDPTPQGPVFSAGPVIAGLNILPGTYYLVASSTEEDYEVEFGIEELPCPLDLAQVVYPADDADGIQPNSVTLKWQLSPYCTEYRLWFSSTYWPDDEPNNPATILVDWTNNLAEECTVRNLYNNTNYFWRIDQRTNGGEEVGGCTTYGEVWGFTTKLNIPNLTVTPDRIYEGDTVTLNWNHVFDRTYRSYRIYKDGELIHTTPVNEVVTSWVVPASELEYNYPDTYTFNVTAVYDEGESDFSNDVTVTVGGYSATNGINGYVYEQDSITPIAGVTVTITGTDALLSQTQTYTATTNANGYYEVQVYEGTYTSAIATMDGYQDAEPYQNGPEFYVGHNAHHDDMNFIMHEVFFPPVHVCARPVYVPGVQGDTLVQVYWSFPNTAQAFEAQIGEGTSTTGYFPFYTLYNYGVHTTLYTAEELQAAGVTAAPMTSLSWYATNSISESQTGITIWMANVTDTEVSTTSPLATGMTKVYTGTLNQPTPTGWVEFVFNEGNFSWDGQSNILILCQRNCGDWTSSIQWQAGTVGFNAMGYVYQDSNPYNVETTTYTLTRSTTRPNIIMRSGRSAQAEMPRSLHHFNIYRTDCYNDGPYTNENTDFLSTAWVPDTSYFDVSWPAAEPGTYKFGVSAVYAGNRVEYPAEERESEIIWHTDCAPCIDKDMQTDITVNVVCNSADSPEGCVVSFTNLNEGEQNNHPQHSITLDDSGFQAITPFRKGDYLVTVYLPGYELFQREESIWGHRDLRYVLTEIIYNVKGLYVSRTGWAMWQPETWEDYPIPGGASVGPGLVDFNDGQMPEGWTTIANTNTWHIGASDGYSHNAQDGSMLYINGSYGGGYDYFVSPAMTFNGNGSLSFDYVTPDWVGDQNTLSIAYGASATGPWTTIWGPQSANSWTTANVDLSALNGSYYIAFVSYNDYGYSTCIDNINFNIGGSRAVAEERHLEGYKVMCTSIDGQPIFNHNTPVDQPFCQLTTVDPWSGQPMLIEGEHYLVKVATIYSTGESPWCEPVEWVYEPCDHWGPVDEVTAGTNNQGNHIEWVFDHGYNPYAPVNPDDPTPTPGDNVTIVLSYPEDIWEDGTGYQMLLDADATACGVDYQETGGYGPTNYANFEYLIPENASYPANTGNIVGAGSSANIQIPAGTYDWVIVNPTNGGGTQYITAGNGNVGGRQNDYVFEAGKIYTFTISSYYPNDGCDVVITDARGHVFSAGANHMAVNNADARRNEHNSIAMSMEGEIYSQYADNGVLLSFLAIKNYDFRAYLLYTLIKNTSFELIPENEYGQFVVTSDSENFMSEFESVYANALADFDLMSKNDIFEQMPEWKNAITSQYFLSITMDLALNNSRVENDQCINSLPFCTSEMIQFEAANTSNTAQEEGMDDGCIGSSYNPSFYHMRIHTGGPFIIHMEGHDPNTGVDRDIDFCMWGPYTEQEVMSGYACTHLTGDKIMDCCYSAEETEDCYLGYDPSTHDHHGYSSHGTVNYHMPEVGEYYILMITNFSREDCVINFTKTEGEGETDCEIVNPTNIIGFLVTLDGEYLDIVGPDVREYDHVGEFGNHEYCVRPIYPGLAQLPDSNFYFSMGCPVCASTNGEVVCDAGDPIYAEVNGTDDQVHIWWGDQPVPPTPEPVVLFQDDFEDGAMANWVTIDADNDGEIWEPGTPAEYGIGDAHSGTYCATSWSWNSYTYEPGPDNWMISPAVDGAMSVTYYVSTNTGYPDHYAVMASSTGMSPSDFSIVMEEDAPVAKGAVAGVRSSKNNPGDRAMGPWVERTVELPAGTRYVAFRHFDSYDMNYLFIDDVTIMGIGRANRSEIVSYNIYRSEDNVDYALIANVPANEDNFYEYFDAPEAGTYYYQVTALYADGCESEPAISGENPEVNYVVVGVTGVGENSDNVNLFPNPTKGNVTIQAMNMHRITVVSVLGQVVFDTELDQDEYILNMAKFNTGMYMVRVYTDEGVTVKRVTVLH